MGSKARKEYAEARKIADQKGDPAVAQVADVQSAFTFALAGDAPKAIKELKSLSEKPVNQDNAAMIWLTLGHAYEVAKDTGSARDSYTRARSLAPPDSRAYTEAGESIERLH